MAVTTTISTAAKQAHANRLVGGSDLLQAKYCVMYDSAALAVRTLASNTTAIVPPLALTTVVASGTATAPAGVTTPIVGGYIIGDVGANHIDSEADALALCTPGTSGILAYVLATIVLTAGDVIAVTAADDIKISTTCSF
jgi:hypothetical protein